jgi:hypothetical protein
MDFYTENLMVMEHANVQSGLAAAAHCYCTVRGHSVKSVETAMGI